MEPLNRKKIEALKEGVMTEAEPLFQPILELLGTIHPVTAMGLAASISITLAQRLGVDQNEFAKLTRKMWRIGVQ